MDADPGTVVGPLQSEAKRADQRRLLVVAGDRDRTYEWVQGALESVDPDSATLVGERDALDCERVSHSRAGQLLGTTQDVVVVDAHDRLDPNALGKVVGAVDGGGLLVLLVPPLSEWPDRIDEFDETLAVAPYDAEAVGGGFRRRLVETIRTHPGVAVVDVDSGSLVRDGLTDPPDRIPPTPVERPDGATVFPEAAYDAAVTADQAEAVAAMEALAAGEAGDGADPRAVVVEADRGRGKSSAAGIATAALAAERSDVLVTAPEFRSAAEVFARARETIRELEVESGRESGDGSGPGKENGSGRETETGSGTEGDERTVTTASGGRIRYLPPAEAVEAAPGADAVVVDEAAALSVRRLSELLAADRVAFTTTVHGYEGAGRGFSVRFRERLDESDHRVEDLRIDEPIRYAPNDPVESWAFRGLLLDAHPPVEQLVEDATPEAVGYRQITTEELLADEHLLREVFGLLVLAHYRTEPDDLARLLDAPNVSVRALLYEGHVVSVALLAEEGGLPESTRRETYDGARIRGHMLPDVLVSQLRDEDAGVPVGQRVMRIATHHAVRSRGLGSELLARIRTEYEGEVDWLGTGFGATPGLVEFWSENGYRTVHLSVTRNDRSGEHSVLMLSPLNAAGRDLCERHAKWFAERVGPMLSDPLSAVDPDVVRATLGTVGVECDPDLSDRGWRMVAGAAYGPGLFKANPGPFRELVLAHLLDPVDHEALSPREERLLVATILQGRDTESVSGELGYHSRGEALRAVGEAVASLADCYATAVAREERDRYT